MGSDPLLLLIFIIQQTVKFFYIFDLGFGADEGSIGSVDDHHIFTTETGNEVRGIGRNNQRI